MKPITLRLSFSFLLLVPASLAVTCVLFLMQASTNTDIWAIIIESRGLTFLLNGLPVLLTMLLLFFAGGNFVAACGLTAVFFMALAVINRYMIALRHAPLQPFDLLLGAEFFGIAKSIRASVFIAVGAGLLVFAALFILALKWLRNTRLPLVMRIIGTAACVAVMAVLNLTVYSSTGLNDNLPYRGNVYNETAMFQSKGFTYSFIYAFNTGRVTRPDYYEQYRKTVEALEQEAQEKAASFIFEERGEDSGLRLPNIIMVLSEAFSELPMSEAVDFEGYTDPLQHYKAIKEESFSGYMVAPHIGGGTADTEFDILTGLNTRFFRGVPYSFSMVTRSFPGVVSLLKAAGYDACGLHPGSGWFYNRQNVYPLLGFDVFWDEQTYDTSDTKGMYITERQTIARIISEYENHLNQSPEVPFLLDCITIQNHGPYFGKYADVEQNFNTDAALSDEDLACLSHYFEGVIDCDRELFKLVEYLRTVAEPTVLVYFGDHLPSLSSEVYQALIPEPTDTSPGEPLIRYNRVPFMLWPNDAARSLIDFTAFEASLYTDRTISAHYLGAAIVEALGLDGVDPLIDYVNGLRGKYPVVLEQTYRASDGVTHVFKPEEALDLALYRCWAYARITG